MEYKPDDLVRVIAVQPGTMIESYLGSEGRVISRTEDGQFYTVELDVGRANIDRGGQLGPRFIVREDCLDPDVTEKMLEAADRIIDEWGVDQRGSEEENRKDRMDLAHDIYRAMRAARFEL